ncbi:TonB-dependent receptor [Actibacterium lipolyticum]|uniref:Putative TonB-dependent receptor BfrD n=1 Tax=Actibacterium lipolyticum TaxID=1524263 RepID=A0A238KM35_9RHOB|nr:TonB-dependent siderophore receptor [Actibacterium lipolyticum]SMX43717.1 putative TonB-dependent receptor BfrD precursor [Actibacterium lipolyticum]
MRTLRQAPSSALLGRASKKATLFGASLSAACFAGQAYGQAVDEAVIVLPTVEVETTEAPAPAPAPAVTPRRAAPTVVRTAVAPTVCTPALAGTEVCADQEAAERAAAEAAAAAEARAWAQAGGNPNADPDAPFKADRLNNAKLPGEIIDTPRTVTAITQETIETKGTTSIRQLARTTPGISLGFGEGGSSFGDNIYIRGFRANNDIYVDGVRDPGISVHETFSTEQVEVIKGPAGSVGGRGTTGGTLNIASKKPQDVDFYKTSTKVTSAGTKRQTFDFNWGENEKLQFRLNGMLQEGEIAGREDVNDDRSGLAGALRYRFSPSVTLEADYTYTKIEQTPDWGVPYINDGDTTDGIAIPSGPVTELGIDRDTFYGVAERDFQTVEQNVATGRLIWDISPSMKLTNTLRASTSINDFVLTAPSSVTDNGSANPEDWDVGLSFKSRYQKTDVISNDLELAGESDWLGKNHTWIAGVSLSSEAIKYTNYNNLQSEDYEPPAGQRGCTVSAVNPDPTECWLGTSPVRGDSFTKTKVKTASIYALDTVELSDAWSVNAGLRLDHYEIDRTGTARDGSPYDYSRSDTMLNGNLGVTWKPRQDLRFYAAAATSTNPMGQEVAAGGGYYGGLDEGGQDLDPEQNTSFEFGAKYELQEHLLLTAALFQTTKANAREDIGPRGSSVTQDTLKYRMRGLELGVSGKVSDRIGLFGGAVFMESETLESDVDGAKGQEVPTIAHEQFNLLATYDLTDAFMLGLQANYTGTRELGGSVPNGNTLPSYWTVDLVGSYALNDTTAIRFGVDNLADETYYDTAYRSGEPFTYVAPGREIWASLEMKF